MAKEVTMGRGSATTLKGVAYTLSIFVEQGEASWTKDDKLAQMEEGRVAERWLVEEAKRHGVALSFHEGSCFGLDASLRVTEVPVDEEGRVEVFDVLRQTLRSVGREGPAELSRSIVRKAGVNTLHVVTYLNTDGVSCAAPFRDGNAEERLLEGCVVHRADSRSGADTGPRTIAHEILHLYGAWDFYERPGYKPEQVVLATREFPRDVMLCASPNLEESEVGPVTAWRIGWRPKEAWFEELRPEGH